MNIFILARFYVLLHEFNNSNKLKLMGVYHNTSTHEQLTCAKHLINSKVANNYLQCTQGVLINVSINRGDCHTLNL
jgi:CRISPR/Cas system-associated endonuclease Cas1